MVNETYVMHGAVYPIQQGPFKTGSRTTDPVSASSFVTRQTVRGLTSSRGIAPVWIHNPPPISKTGSVCDASCRGAEPQYHQNINKKLGLYSVGNGLSK